MIITKRETMQREEISKGRETLRCAKGGGEARSHLQQKGKRREKREGAGERGRRLGG